MSHECSFCKDKKKTFNVCSWCAERNGKASCDHGKLPIFLSQTWSKRAFCIVLCNKLPWVLMWIVSRGDAMKVFLKMPCCIAIIYEDVGEIV